MQVIMCEGKLAGLIWDGTDRKPFCFLENVMRYANYFFIWARMDDMLMFNIIQMKMIKHMSKYLFFAKIGPRLRETSFRLTPLSSLNIFFPKHAHESFLTVLIDEDVCFVCLCALLICAFSHSSSRSMYIHIYKRDKRDKRHIQNRNTLFRS